LSDLYEEIKPKCVSYENVINRPKESGVEVAHCYGAFRGILLEVCALKGIEVLPVGIQQIKMCVTGKGNSQKELVMSCVQRDFPMQKVTDHNQSDALALLKVTELIRAGRWVMPTNESKKKSFKGNRDAWAKKLKETQPQLF